MTSIPGPLRSPLQGAWLLLNTALIFEKEVHFHGEINVSAQRPLEEACLELKADGFVEPTAALRVEDCHNIRKKGSGGGISVNGSLHVSGALQIHNCSAKWNGGSLGLGSVLLFCPWVVAIREST